MHKESKQDNSCFKRDKGVMHKCLVSVLVTFQSV